MRGHRTAEHLSRDVRLGRAAHMREQAGEVRLRRGPAVEPKPIGEPGGDQRAAQAVLEWKGHPQVGREAEHSDDLGGTDALGLSGPLVAHT